MGDLGALIVVLLAALPFGLAQQGTPGKNPQTLATIRLPLAARKNLERVIFAFLGAPAEDEYDLSKQVEFERLRLGPQDRWVWQARAPDRFCGSHAKCEYWLFDPVTGESLADEVLGLGIDVAATRHHGWRDFSTSGAISYCEILTSYYRFDGRKYRNVRTTSDKSACEAQ